MSNATGTFSIRERPQHLAKEEALSISTARTSHRNSFRNSAGTDHGRSFFLCGGGELFILQSNVVNGDKRHGDFRPDLDHEPDIYPVLGLPLAPPASMLFGFLAVASCDKTSRAMAVLRTLAASWRSHAHQASSLSPVQADR